MGSEEYKSAYRPLVPGHIIVPYNNLAGLESIALPASGLGSIPVPAGVSSGEVVIRATVPIVVQRMLLRGHDLIGRSAVLALPTIPSPEVGS